MGILVECPLVPQEAEHQEQALRRVWRPPGQAEAQREGPLLGGLRICREGSSARSSPATRCRRHGTPRASAKGRRGKGASWRCCRSPGSPSAIGRMVSGPHGNRGRTDRGCKGKGKMRKGPSRTYYKRFKSCFKTFNETFGDMKTCDITDEDLKRYCARRERSVAPITLDSEIVTIRSMVNRRV